jgi:hypothetical protein
LIEKKPIDALVAVSPKLEKGVHGHDDRRRQVGGDL